MLYTLGQWRRDQNLTLHSLVVPDADAWLGSDLARGADLAVWVHRDAVDIVRVIHKMLLRVGACIHNDAYTGCNVGQLTIGSITQVIAAIVAAEAVNVL